MMEEILEKTLNEEIARELIMEKYGDVDEERFVEALAKAPNNGWDAAIIYDLIDIVKVIEFVKECE